MNSKAGREGEESIHQIRAERTENKPKLRKKRINEKIFSKRIPPSLPKEAFIEAHPSMKAPEAIEDTKTRKDEPREPKGLTNLSNFKKKPGKQEENVGSVNHPTLQKKLSKHQVLPLSQAGTYEGALLQKKSGFYLQLVMGDEPEIYRSPKKKI